MSNPRDLLAQLMGLLEPYAYPAPPSRVTVEYDWSALVADVRLMLKPPADATAETPADARRVLYDVAEAALAAVEAAGWRHAEAPNLRITGLDVTSLADAEKRFVWEGHLALRLHEPKPQPASPNGTP